MLKGMKGGVYMQFCKHTPHRVLEVWEPRYSTKDVLINKNKISPTIEHYLLRFTKANSLKDWYYFSGDTIRKSKEQKNGYGTCYIVDFSNPEIFNAPERCIHEV